MEYERVMHTFEPVYDDASEILILGTMPSVRSREQNFYYGHKQNRFWKVIAGITNNEEPKTIPEKKKLLLASHIAIWDVVKECEIIGSSDSSIRNVKVNDVEGLLKRSAIRKVAANGRKAAELYNRYLYNLTGREIIVMPSTSPANAAYSLERLCDAYKTLLYKE